MFDNISHKYDFLNHLLSFGIDKGWRRKLRKTLEVFQPKNLLDVATGTGDLAIELANIPGLQITGIDISQGMLNMGKPKLAKLGLENRIRLQHADSENLPFEDNTFDAISVGFGVRNFEDLRKGLGEMRRVLKDGGHLAVLEFSKPKNRLVGAVYWFYFINVLPFVGKLFSQSSTAYTYLPESVTHFPEGESFTKIVMECGYKTAEIRRLTFGISTLYLCEK